MDRTRFQKLVELKVCLLSQLSRAQGGLARAQGNAIRTSLVQHECDLLNEQVTFVQTLIDEEAAR